MTDHTEVEARLKGPTSRWKRCTEVERTDTYVRVVYEGKHHTLPLDQVRPRTTPRAYREG